jgi:hypothetical protein
LFDKKGKGYYFDPLGEEPETAYWRRYLTKNSQDGVWESNDIDVQDFEPNICGHLCILYIFTKFNNPGKSNVKVVEMLSAPKAVEIVR